jgi:hypothetical protein
MQDLHFAIRYQTIYYRFAHVTRITSFSKVAFCALHKKTTCLLLTGQDVTPEWVLKMLSNFFTYNISWITIRSVVTITTKFTSQASRTNVTFFTLRNAGIC